MKPTITIVTPVFNEREGLESYRRRISESMLASPDFDFEVVLVDDGSTDDSWLAIRELVRSDPRFHALRLSRNWGAHVAIQAGLGTADKDAALVLACDLQDPPEAALKLCHAWRETGANIVWGFREARKEGWPTRAASHVFNVLLKRFAFDRSSQFTSGSFLLADRKVIDAYRRFDERQRITFAMMAWMGFKQARVGYVREPRRSGSSGWTFLRMLNASFDTFLGYSDAPIKLITLIGFGLFLFSAGFGIYVLYSYCAGHPQTGWPSLALMMAFFFGLLFLTLGVLGEYLRRIYIEVLKRPSFIILEKL